jgi:hypothetical protein
MRENHKKNAIPATPQNESAPAFATTSDVA